MSNEESIFAEAMGMPSDAERAAYLDRACAGDAQLRRDVEALLLAHHRADGILESPPAASRADRTSATLDGGVGRTVGPYKLLEQIGAGGMGVVYMAEQQRPVRRVVALKIIKPGMDTRQVIARFEAERQALTMMDHPNIAHVLDAGTTDSGLPYFVMELVKGIPIIDYCDQAHLTTRERLELFIPVCHAVQHAHQKGVIHRDLKPGNILVTLHDDQPVPKVIDFGIAKATGQALTDKTLFTQFAQMIGTPLYMSPEQAALSAIDVDTRSDVYSLGVLLYELLTGTTPFEKKRLVEAAYDEVRRIIREEEPPKPSTRLSMMGAQLIALAAHRQTDPRKLGQLMRGELDWIVMKAIEKDRTRRYDTPNDMARDVARYLGDEPVAACPPSASYKARKFIGKHKGKLATTAVIALALLVAMAAVGWGLRDRQTRTMLVQQAVTPALDNAEKFYSEGMLVDALAEAKRADAALSGGPVNPALTTRAQSMLNDLALVQRLEQIRDKDADALWASSDSYHTPKAYSAAFRAAGIDVEALSVQEAADRIKARPRITVALAAALDEFAFTRSQGFTSVGADITKLRAIAAAADENPWRQRLRKAVMKEDREATALRELADDEDLARQPPSALLALARELTNRGQSKTAQELLRKALLAHPADFWLNHTVALALRDQGDAESVAFARVAASLRPDSGVALASLYGALREAGKKDEAQEVWRRAERLMPDDEAPQRARAEALRHDGMAEAADAAMRRAVEISRRAVQREPTSAMAHLRMGLALLDAADALREPNLHAEAMAALQQAEKLEPLSATEHCTISASLRHSGMLAEAVASARRAVELDPTSPLCYYQLGVALADQGKLEEAAAAMREAVELDPLNAFSQHTLGAILSKQGRFDEAARECREAIRCRPDLAKAHDDLIHVLLGQGKGDEARAAAREANRLMPSTTKGFIALAWLCLDYRQAPAEAETAARHAVAIGEKRIANSPPTREDRAELGESYVLLARILCEQGDTATGIEW